MKDGALKWVMSASSGAGYSGMDEMKKLELAIELAKLDALDQIRIAIARAEGRRLSSETDNLLAQAMQKVESFEANLKKKAPADPGVSVTAVRDL